MKVDTKFGPRSVRISSGIERRQNIWRTASAIALDVVTRKETASGYLLAISMYVSMNIFLAGSKR